MKKFLTLILVFVAALTFAACGNDDFKHDGDFTAFEVGVNQKGPMLTSVTVTIKDGAIEKFFIDCRQGTATYGPVAQGEGTVDKWTFSWKEKTKKELGYLYQMHFQQFGAPVTEENVEAYKTWLTENDKLEWFEQAELLEAEFLANGPESVTVDNDKYIENVAGVTIKDGSYTKLAKEAIQNAKAGKVVAFEHTMNYGIPNVVWVTLTVAKGKAKALVVDTIQATADNSSGTVGLVWNQKSKQELGYLYEMHWQAFGERVTEDNVNEYKTWLKENNKLEWFEQVKIITDDILKNGLKTQPATPLAGVSITTDSYYRLINEAYARAGLN